jgi:peptidoglycan/LPS O-acetylase OafA/YrhL
MHEKIGYLDGLRGVAALSVTVCHFIIAFYPALMISSTALFITGLEPLVYATPLNILYNGSFAVCVFFVLSGYVLTYKYFASGNQEVLRSGAIRRYFRLVPTVAFSVVCFLIVLIFLRYVHIVIQPLTGGSLEAYFALPIDIVRAISEALIGDFIGINPSISGYLYNNVLWTMQVEFIGSMIIFAFAFLFGMSRNRWIFYLVALFFFANTFYLAFIIGALLADIVNSKTLLVWKSIKLGKASPLLAIFLIFGGLLFATNNGHTYYDWIYQTVPLLKGQIPFIGVTINPMIIGAGMIMAAVINSEQLKKLLSAKPLLFIGAISFSMYLMHYMLLAIVSVPLFTALYVNFHMPYLIALMVTFVISIPVIFFISYLTYRFVDAPGTRLSKKIYERYFAGEQKPFDLAAIKKHIVSFEKTYVYRIGIIAQKNIALLVILEVLMVFLIGGMVFVAKPAIDRDRALQAEAYYDERLNDTITAYNNLNSYTGFNNTSLGAYKIWMDRYENNVLGFSSVYNDLKQTSESNKQYYSPDLQENVSYNVWFYGALVNESMNKSKAYENAYNDWYWNNTPVTVK